MKTPRKQSADPAAGSIGGHMISRLVSHVRGNVVGYVALFAALGGTSYAAVSITPGSVTTRALANGAVTHAKLARNSIAGSNLRAHSLTATAFKPGALNQLVKSVSGAAGTNGADGAAGGVGPAGADGSDGADGAAGASGPAGHDGSASIAARARNTGSVTAPGEASTNVPLTGATWTQAANSLNLITGSMNVTIPSSCTGSFGNDLIVSIDGTANTFAVAPSAPASSTVTVPFAVSEVTEPGSDTNHTLTAALANTCTKSGESYTVNDVKIDVVNFN